MKLLPVPSPVSDKQHMNQQIPCVPWQRPVASVWCIALAGLLIAAGLCQPSHGMLDSPPLYEALCAPFHQAIEAGDDAAALALGQDLYTRLAVQADGREPFYSCGVVLVTAWHAADHVVNLRAHPDQAGAWSPLESLWRILPAPLKAPAGDPAQREPGRFLRAYLHLCIVSHMQRVLPAEPAGASEPAPMVQSVADSLVLLMGMLDPESLAGDQRVSRAVAWLVAAGQAERATDQALGHGRPGVACAVGKAALAANPADSDVRKQLVELVGSLCKAQYVPEAISLCAAAREITRDASYSSVLILQQAVIASRDQKNHALAVRLCDEVAAATDDVNTILVAKYLAGTFLLEQGEYPQLIGRTEAMAKDPATPLPYRLKASTLRATAWTRQDKPEEAVKVLTEALEGLAEPEPAEAADCRQVLCQAMLSLQRYEDATRECRLLIARHPGHTGAAMASQMLEKMGAKPDPVPTESRK